MERSGRDRARLHRATASERPVVAAYRSCSREFTHRKEKSVMSSLEGKVAVVTGGNSGIGLATAREFHANGAKVVISGRDRGTLEEVSRQLGHNVLAVPTDVTKPNDIDQVIAPAHHTIWKIGILFFDTRTF